jgi:abortive infection bacteriophage resistance protein
MRNSVGFFFFGASMKYDKPPFTTVLKSWLDALNVVRNICAHHGRLWNRELGYRIMIPGMHKYPEWHTLLQYLLGRVAPTSKWPVRLQALLKDYPAIPIRLMGFPSDWGKSPIWKR